MISLLTFIMLMGMATPVILIILSTVRAIENLKKPKEIFFLPHDFFISLVFLVNYWVILLILLGSHALPDHDAHIIIVLLSLFVPFLSWWQKKRRETKL